MQATRDHLEHSRTQMTIAWIVPWPIDNRMNILKLHAELIAHCLKIFKNNDKNILQHKGIFFTMTSNNFYIFYYSLETKILLLIRPGYEFIPASFYSNAWLTLKKYY